MKSTIEQKRAGFVADRTASVEKRNQFQKEVDTLNVRITQLDGAVFALDELLKPAPEEDKDASSPAKLAPVPTE